MNIEIKPAVNRFITRLSEKSFVGSTVYHRRLLLKSMSKYQDQVLVYQMGKVGSTAVWKSLQRFAPHLAVHHVHMLTETGIRRFESFVRESFRRELVSSTQRKLLARHLVTVKYFKRLLDQANNEGRWKVVSIVREPIGRNISSFFEILDLQMDYGLQKKLDEIGSGQVMNELHDLFLNHYPDHYVPLTFFDAEIKEALGVDVYAQPFPRQEGYCIYNHRTVQLLVLRLEDLNRCVGRAMEEFLGLKGFQLEKANVGTEKIYSEIYRRFQKEVCLPRDYVDEMYRSKYTTHFYSQDEIRSFMKKWNIEDPAEK